LSRDQRWQHRIFPYMRGLTAVVTDLLLFMRARSPTTVVASKRAVSSYDQTVTASRRRPAVTPRSLLHVACAGTRHLLASLQDKQSRRRQKRQVTFLLFGRSMG